MTNTERLREDQEGENIEKRKGRIGKGGGEGKKGRQKEGWGGL